MRGPGRPRKHGPGRPPKNESKLELTDYALEQIGQVSPETATLHARIPVPLKERIRAIAEATGAEMSHVVEIALRNELERWTA